MQNNKPKVCVDLFDPDEETFKGAIAFLDKGEMLRCTFEHNGKPYERAVIFGQKPSFKHYEIEWQAWQNAKARAIAGE